VGLDGTGDQTTQMPYTSQSLMSYLQQLGITLPPGSNAQLQLRNVAAVIVSAQLPAFAQPGQTLDVNVASMGNATSLRGGMLIAFLALALAALLQRLEVALGRCLRGCSAGRNRQSRRGIRWRRGRRSIAAIPKLCTSSKREAKACS